MKTAARSELRPLKLDRASDKPLNRQIHGEIAAAVLAGKLKPGSRLPSTRMLSNELGVSRNTVNAAYEQLAAEGYIESAVGAGTRIASLLPADLLGQSRSQRPGKVRAPRLSRRGAAMARATVPFDVVERRAPGIGEPAIELFPFRIWKHLMARQFDSLAKSELGYANPAGFLPLREQIATYLESTRGIRVSSRRILVVAGTQQALDLVARLLLDAGDRVLVEDPGYPGARAALLAACAELVPVSVDAEGMDVGSLRHPHRKARAAYVTPAHHFPLGATMTLGRRLALLEWAEGSNAFILEDDYDGEFRYAGSPLSAIASIDTGGRVIYIGSFSKLLYPSLRLGFMVLPEELLPRIVSVRGFTDRHSPVVEQATLAAFMGEGHFARHVRQMRAIYEQRRSALIEALSRHAGDLVDVVAPETGMHLLVGLRGLNDKRAAEAIGPQKLAIVPISNYYHRSRRCDVLLLGFAQCTPDDVDRSVRNLAKAVRTLKKRH
ncbi:MAG TPA: PLP-dependent aminotransferase family protein [Candidatus Acidoferrales bacterium]|nr:PLP-dependent aminotransferase family protein [Candidatus Acidoferrales bacterium]